jgi:ubiquinone/menaquinone biosynthesis C-methylase UbiE
MLIDNFHAGLTKVLIDPVSRESLILKDGNLVSESGFSYQAGDFRITAGSMVDQKWQSGQLHYEEFNKTWINQSEEFYSSVDLETRSIYSDINLKGNILDVGGGFGTVTKQAKLDPCSITVVDPMVCCWDAIPDSPYKNHYSVCKTVVRIPGFAEDLPFRNSIFDTVHIRSCLDHFSNPHRALLEARRVLKNDGCLVIGVSLEGSFKLSERTLKNKIYSGVKSSILGRIYGSLFDHHVFHPTENSLRALIRGAGFDMNKWIKQEGYSNVVYLTALKARRF